MTVLITGGNGSLAKELAKTTKHKLITLGKEHLDVKHMSQLENVFLDFEFDTVIHCAALTYPMKKHEEDPITSVKTNIIGSSNIGILCHKFAKKFVYISTDYVYEGKKSYNKESDPILPRNKYAWSKLGGECVAQIIPNSLILRCSHTERPFRHPQAFSDSYKSFLYVDEIAPLIWKAIDSKMTGIINIGGKRRSIFEFAKESNPKIEPCLKPEHVPFDTSLDLTKLESL